MKKFLFVIGFLFTGGGSYLLSVNDIFLRILGAIVTIIGGYLLYRNGSKNSKQDKEEIIEKIEEFRDKLEDLRLLSDSKETTEKIIKIENEFDQWARSFSTNLHEKKLQLTSADIALEKKKIDLSREYRKFYVSFFEILYALINAYNKSSTGKIKLIEREEIPLNLFLDDVKKFKWVIQFNNNIFWYLLISAAEPLEEDVIPSINILVQESTKRPLLEDLGSDLKIYFSLERRKWNLEKRNFFRKITFNKEGDLNEYEIDFQNILKQAVEYQILAL